MGTSEPTVYIIYSTPRAVLNKRTWLPESISHWQYCGLHSGSKFMELKFWRGSFGTELCGNFELFTKLCDSPIGRGYWGTGNILDAIVLEAEILNNRLGKQFIWILKFYFRIFLQEEQIDIFFLRCRIRRFSRLLHIGTQSAVTTGLVKWKNVGLFGFSVPRYRRRPSLFSVPQHSANYGQSAMFTKLLSYK